MDDLYAEVMSLLHDTGAFAEWQKDKRMAQVVAKTRYVAVADMPRPEGSSVRLTDGTSSQRDPGGPPPGHSPATNKSSARRLPRPMSPSIAPK